VNEDSWYYSEKITTGGSYTGSPVQGYCGWKTIWQDYCCPELDIGGGGQSSRLELHVGGPDISTGTVCFQKADDCSTTGQGPRYSSEGK